MLSDEAGKRKGIYTHPIIQKAVNKMWFKNKRDEGITYPDYFNPVSVPSIALILTAVSRLLSFPFKLYSNCFFRYHFQIECNIDEWATGLKTDITFWAEEYRPVYEAHVASLNQFGAYSDAKELDLLGRIQRKLYNYGR